MDEYLTKPLQLQLLKAALRKWLPGVGDTRPAPLSQTDEAPAKGALDIAVLQSIVGDDPEMVSDMLFEYRASQRRLKVEMQAARATHDLQQIGTIAHKLKSSSRSVGAMALGDLCTELENACRMRALEAIARCMAQFDAELAAVDAALDRALDGSNAAIDAVR